MSKRKMYKAVCSECGQEFEVPFEPNANMPIFCQECYSSKKKSMKESASIIVRVEGRKEKAKLVSENGITHYKSFCNMW